MDHQGSSNRQIYDVCAYEQWLHTSTTPLNYALYMGKNENCGKCRYDKFWRPFDLVDVESELRNQTRPVSRCGILKYNKNCSPSKYCLSTYDKSVPVVFAPEICPIVFNNIPKQISVGYTIPSTEICGVEEGHYYPVKK